MLFALSDVVYQALIAGAVTLALAYMQFKLKASVEKAAATATEAANQAAVKTEEVKRSLEKVVDTTTIAAEQATDKVVEVKEALEITNAATDEKLDNLTKVAEETQKVGEAIHVLVNSSMSRQLQISMVALKRVSDLTKDKDDIMAWELAKGLYEDHENKQKIVDEGAKIPTGKKV